MSDEEKTITATGGQVIEVPEIKGIEIRYLEQIGRGCFGTVFLGHCRGKTVAVKRLNTQRFDKKVLEDFKKEVAVFTHLRHPNVVLFMGACTEPGDLCIVTEYMPRGDVHAVVHDPNSHLSLQQILKMAVDCASGMSWLHQSIPPIIHRDLKPTNRPVAYSHLHLLVLVDAHLTVKICDFGLSAFLIEEKLKVDKSAPGTPLWMSPEVLTGAIVTEKVDVYAFGIVLWEMVSCQEPFSHHRDYSTFARAIVGGERPPIPENTHPDLSILMQECWQSDPKPRPSFSSLIPRLNEIIVAISTRDPHGASLWREHWTGELSVPWTTFAPAFYQYIGKPLPNDKKQDKNVEYRCLQAILATQPAEGPLEVTLERFGHFLGWFGPLAGTKPFLERLCRVMGQEWFHGDISKAEAESVLMSWKKKGSYLIRTSLTDPFVNPFTISMLNSNKMVDHQRIGVSKGIYFTLVKVKGQTVKLEEEDVEQLVKRAAKHLDLKTECLGSKYAAIFSLSKRVGGGYLNSEFQ